MSRKGGILLVGGLGRQAPQYRALVEGYGYELVYRERRVLSEPPAALAAVLVITSVVSPALRQNAARVAELARVPIVYLRAATVEAVRRALNEALGVPGEALLLATHNPGKVAELTALVQAPRIKTLSDLGLPEPVEDGATFEDNARLKATAAHEASGLWALADDSGLSVDVLHGAPGVDSAYYGGLPRCEEKNRQALLRALMAYKTPEERRARFHCVLCLRGPGGVEVVRSGTLEGHVAHAPRGTGGFGFDPLFVPAPQELAAVGLPAGLTFGELSAEDKHQLSHRARACAAMVPVLRERLRKEKCP